MCIHNTGLKLKVACVSKAADANVYSLAYTSGCFSELFFFYLLRDRGCSGPFQKIERATNKQQEKCENIKVTK